MNPLTLSEAFSTEPQAIPVVGESLRFVSERMSKITQAIVLIATVVHDPHHLVTDLVGYSKNTLADIYDLESDPAYATVADMNRIAVGLRHVVTTTEICHTARLLSDMNYQIIHTELKHLENYIQEKLGMYCIGQVTYPFRVPAIESQTAVQHQVSLEKYFHGNDTPEKTITQPVYAEPKSVAPQHEIVNKSVNDTVHKPEPTKTVEKDIAAVSAQKITFKAPTTAMVSQYQPAHVQSGNTSGKQISGEDKKERRDAIMKTIRSKGQVTIRDISKNIQGCSEKTIQRDLQELIQHGVLIREGEKRWAVYKLAMNNV